MPSDHGAHRAERLSADGDGAALLRRVREERLAVRVSVTTGMDDARRGVGERRARLFAALCETYARAAELRGGLDGTRVASYAQWTSRAAFDAMLRDPAAREHKDAAARVATFEPALYEVASVHRAA